MTIVLSIAVIPLGSGSLPMAASDPSPFPVMLWSGILIAVLVILFLAVSAIRRWLKQDDPTTPLGFTLGDLRTLHRQGKMTDEEFERAKAKMVGQAKVDAERALEAKGQALNYAAPRPDTAEDLAAFARSLREKAAQKQGGGEPPPAPPAPAGGEE